MVVPENDDTGAALEDEAADSSATDAGVDDESSDDESPQRMNLEVDIASPNACERHITVAISAEDVQRYFKEKFDELVSDAQVPGFRAGRAPRKLVETRFRKEVAEQVKGSLLMDSMAQINEDHKLAAISEPDLDLETVPDPGDGPLKFEFDLEVRPEFDMPQWKGLKIERATHEFGKEDIDARLEKILSRQGEMAPYDGPAGDGDFVVCNLVFRHEGKELSRCDEQSLRVRPVLSLTDGKVEGFDKLVGGATAGDRREGKVALSENVIDQSLRDKEIDVEIEVLEVKKLELPELNDEFLDELGGFETEGDLRDAIQADLERQLEYQQQQQARQEVTALLTQGADWKLPSEMLKHQAGRELDRSVMELRRSGFTDEMIQQHANELRQNSMARTASALKEHFILERIAEDEDIDVTELDYDVEIQLIAQQSNENPRRVRASLEKRGMMDALRNQIVERKVIALVIEEANFIDVPYQQPSDEEVVAIDHSAADRQRGGDIPEATGGGEAEKLPEPEDHS